MMSPWAPTLVVCGSAGHPYAPMSSQSDGPVAYQRWRRHRDGARRRRDSAGWSFPPLAIRTKMRGVLAGAGSGPWRPEGPRRASRVAACRAVLLVFPRKPGGPGPRQTAAPAQNRSICRLTPGSVSLRLPARRGAGYLGKGQMNFRWLTGYITPGIRHRRLRCSPVDTREAVDRLLASPWITAVKCG